LMHCNHGRRLLCPTTMLFALPYSYISST
jgi:hypothetical protein